MSIEWKEIVRAVAPALGTALGTPLIGTAVGVLAEALLGDPGAGEEAVKAAVLKGMTPEQLVAAKRADQEFAIKMKEAGIRLEQIEAADRASARERESKVGAAATRGIHILAALILGTFGYAVYWVLDDTSQIPADPEKLIMVGTVIGYVSSKADQVVSYFFGSSAGSKEKSIQMAEALQKATVNK